MIREVFLESIRSVCVCAGGGAFQIHSTEI